ncbi:hypothetical protein BO78DRAFT_343343, partial [Aspergillus sclerotiicarbonarius CBS 121057]
MATTLLPRRLPSLLKSAPSPARPSWLTLNLNQHNLPRQQTRSLTQTPHLSSSPFRLTSNNPSSSHSHETPPEYTNPNEYYSPYKPKRQWPPDMSKLSPKHQFRLERKYRRRAALKYARPKWTKATKLVQWGAIGFVLVYAMLFMEWDERGSPFDEIRRTFFAGVKGAFSTPPPPGPVRRDE